MKSLYIGLDFDGTMVEHKYPEIGAAVKDAIETVLDLQAAGHKIILHTMRDGERLAQAVEYLEDNGIKLYAVNENPSQKYWTKNTQKVHCNIYIDDCGLGTPLVTPQVGKPFVDWEEVRELLDEKGVL